MYITLNSATESNDANFSNNFSDTMVIKPFSYVCLNGAGFQTHDTSFDLGYIATFDFRIQMQYVGTSVLYTFPAGDYTVQSFATQFNLLVANFSHLYTMKMNPNDAGAAGLHMTVELFRNPNYQTPYLFAETYYDNDTCRIAPLIGQNAAAHAGQAPVLTAPSGVDRVLDINGILANNYDFVCAARAPYNALLYREPVNMPYRYNFESNRIQGEMTFCLADGGRYGDFYLYDQIYYNDNLGYVTTINQAHLGNNYITRISFPNTGVATLTMRKNDNTVHTFATRIYNPGDTFKITFTPQYRTTPGSVGSYDNVVEHMKNTLLQTAWIPCDWPNVGTINPPLNVPYTFTFKDLLCYQTDYPCGDAEYKKYIGENYTGPRLGFTDNITLGVAPAANSHRVQVQITGVGGAGQTKIYTYIEAEGLNTIMPNGNGLALQRFHFDAPNSQQNQCIEIGTNVNEGLESSLPTAFTCCFRFKNDVPLGGNTNMVLFGGNRDTGARIIMASIIIGGVTIQINDFLGGNVTLNPLVSGTGAPMAAWAYDTNYCITIGCAGTQNQAISVNITDENNNWYAAVGNTSGANGKLPDLRFIGAGDQSVNNPANVNIRMNGFVWDFRMSQQNLGETIPTSFTNWVNIHNSIAQWSVVTAQAGNQKGDDWFFNFNDRVDWTTGATHVANDIREIQQIRALHRVCPIFQKTDAATPVQTNWTHFGNLGAAHQIDADIANNVLTTDNISWVDIDSESDFTIVTDNTTPVTNPMVIGQNPSIELLIPDAATGVTYAYANIYWTNHTTVSPNYFAQHSGNAINQGVDVREQVYNICIENLPHRTFNGRTNNVCKSIYEILHNETHNTLKGDTELINFIPKHKIWIPLNNAGELPINNLHIKIANARMQEVTDLVGDTHIQLEIKDRQEIFS